MLRTRTCMAVSTGYYVPQLYCGGNTGIAIQDLGMQVLARLISLCTRTVHCWYPQPIVGIGYRYRTSTSTGMLLPVL